MPFSLSLSLSYIRQIFKHSHYVQHQEKKKTKHRINLRLIRLTYNKLSYFSLLTPCRMDERRFKAAASSRTILNIQFELKTLMIRIKQNKKHIEKQQHKIYGEHLWPIEALMWSRGIDQETTYLSFTWPDANRAESWTRRASTHFGSESKWITNVLKEKRCFFLFDRLFLMTHLQRPSIAASRNFSKIWKARYSFEDFACSLKNNPRSCPSIFKLVWRYNLYNNGDGSVRKSHNARMAYVANDLCFSANRPKTWKIIE